MSQRYFENKNHVDLYQKYRPLPPDDLISYIASFTKEKVPSLDVAVDVGCGSGHSTFALASHFTKVIGCDVSPNQLELANQRNQTENVVFQTGQAENLPFDDNSVQLVTAAATIHWLDVDGFLAEANRVLCPGGVLACYTYVIPHFHWPEDPEKEKKFNDCVWNHALHGDFTKFHLPGNRILYSRYSDIDFRPTFTDFEKTDGKFAVHFQTCIRDFILIMQTWSFFQAMREKIGEEETMNMLEKVKKMLIDLIRDESSEDAELETLPIKASYKYVLLLGRKPY